MLDKKDVQWWILEAQKHPESAVDLIRMLADRLAFLDKQNEELRGELTLLRRKQRGDSANDVEALQQRIQELESALRAGKTGQRLLVYAHDRIEANLPLGEGSELSRELPDDVALLACDVTSKLLIITAESQAFNVAANDLPAPTDSPAMLGNPRNVAAIIDQASLERSRFLTLLSRSGYIYSVLVGTVNQVARRQDKLIRHLIPEDPIVLAIPSYNADLVAVSRKGRAIRFSEKAIAGAGSLAMQLPKEDAVAGLAALRGEAHLAFLSMDGKVFVRPSADITLRKTIGMSSAISFKGQSMLGVAAGEEIIVLTRCGKVLMIRLAELPYKAQTESGAPLPGLATDDSVLAWTTR